MRSMIGRLAKPAAAAGKAVRGVQGALVRNKYTLVLVRYCTYSLDDGALGCFDGVSWFWVCRHGESSWNKENKFTGWVDCPLSDNGNQEAIRAGALLKENNLTFDIAYTSMLKRAIKTLWHSLEQTNCMTIPIVNAWQLNERYLECFSVV
jgi:hypothetical protein